eukprot:CAMPEP_0114612304 /NCGR_PEP_ID=MMETSP0168-20121206/4554_1 /TAXON_ID=95228 ORGANISM="Vannella sp., Strain DIVA3 517/6/12" /NCGR_SAMPLE_ID=MMETSP0168 /ASSEMBLY_ACC=CAM_ASM_000044 /LENGTH=217 /DNA_ID=CAMNT_0001823287 /DNA_START=76 /DNA_END=726 /DNA_ORIENTATION=-
MTAFQWASKDVPQEERSEVQKPVAEEDTVPCKYAKHGCNVYMHESERTAHEADYMAAHLALLEDAMESRNSDEIERADRKLAAALQEEIIEAHTGESSGRLERVCKQARQDSSNAQPSAALEAEPLPDHMTDCERKKRELERMMKDALKGFSCRRPSHSKRASCVGLLLFVLIFAFFGGPWILRIPLAVAMASVFWKAARTWCPDCFSARDPAKTGW